jgi:Ran GTPase-activating protein (RanGAP) involved in mRNA processing and transport
MGAIFSSIGASTSMTHVSIRDSILTKCDMRALSDACVRNTSLTSLCIMHDDDESSRHGTLAPAFATLRTVSFHGCLMSAVSICMLEDAIGSSTTLASLNMRDCDVTLIGAMALARALTKSTSIATLVLSENMRIETDGVCALAIAIGASTSMTSFDLNDVDVDDKGSAMLAQHAVGKLARLSLNTCKIREIGARQLAQAIERGSALRYLDVGRNDIASPEVALIVEHAYARGVTSLKLCRNRIPSTRAIERIECIHARVPRTMTIEYDA